MAGKTKTGTLPSAEQLRAEREYAAALLQARESGLLALLWHGEPATARELAYALGYTTQALNNHVKRLMRVGFLERRRQAVTGGGAEWVYRRRMGLSTRREEDEAAARAGDPTAKLISPARLESSRGE